MWPSRSCRWIFSKRSLMLRPLQRCHSSASGCGCQLRLPMIRHQWDFKRTTQGNVANCDHMAAWAQRLRRSARRCDACRLHYAKTPAAQPLWSFNAVLAVIWCEQVTATLVRRRDRWSYQTCAVILCLYLKCKQSDRLEVLYICWATSDEIHSY